MDLLKEALPALCCRLIVFACLAQFQPAARTQLLSGSRATTHGQPICHCHKAYQEIWYSIQKRVPKQTKYRKYYKSGSPLDIAHFDHATRWEMAHNSWCCPFSQLKWFQTFLPALFVHHGPFSPWAPKKHFGCKVLSRDMTHFWPCARCWCTKAYQKT